MHTITLERIYQPLEYLLPSLTGRGWGWVFLLFPLKSSATAGDSTLSHRIEAEIVPGQILHTNRYLKGHNSEVRTMNHAFTARLKYAFLPPATSERAYIYKGVYQGVGLAFHDINPQLGRPLSAFIFQGATIKTILPRLTLNYEWDFGVTMGWKSYDAKKNPFNRVIGSKMTAYIDADIYLRWMLSSHWDLNLGATFTHFSNGNTAMPNAGLNIVGAKLSAAYYLNRHPDRRDTAKPLPPFVRGWHTDLTLYGAWKRKGVDTSEGAYAIPGTFGVIGININPMYEVNHWLNLGASIDTQYDHGSNITIDDEALRETFWNGSEENIHIPAWHKQVSLGLSARAEFVMPYFTINFGIGHNLLNAKSQDFKGLYEILALKVALSRKFYLHVGYSLYKFHYPNNLMLGLGVRLGGG